MSANTVLNERASVALDNYVVDLAWSPDGRSIAVAGGEGAVALVSGADGKLAAKTLGEHGMGTIAVAWQPGGSVIASSGQDSAVALWDSTTGESLKRIRPGVAWTEHIAFAPDGKTLATATGKTLALWDASGEKVHAFDPLPATIAAIAWDKAGNELAAAVAGGLNVFKLEAPTYPSRKHAWPAACLTATFSPNGKVLASGMQDGTVHFWLLLTGKDSQMRGYPSKVTLTEWSANSRYLATAAGGDVIVWDFGGRGPEGTAPLELTGHTDRITHLAFHPEGPWLLSAGRDWRLTLWHPGKEKQAVDAHLTSAEITAVKWSGDGKRVAVGDAKGRVTIYELEMKAGLTPTSTRAH